MEISFTNLGQLSACEATYQVIAMGCRKFGLLRLARAVPGRSFHDRGYLRRADRARAQQNRRAADLTEGAVVERAYRGAQSSVKRSIPSVRSLGKSLSEALIAKFILFAAWFPPFPAAEHGRRVGTCTGPSLCVCLAGKKSSRCAVIPPECEGRPCSKQVCRAVSILVAAARAPSERRRPGTLARSSRRIHLATEQLAGRRRLGLERGPVGEQRVRVRGRYLQGDERGARRRRR